MAEEVARPLVCPSCGATQPLDERFCPDCGMPLTYAVRAGVDEPVSEARDRARKIKPQYSEGELVRVAGAQNQAEAEFIQGLLLEEGVPSSLRRTRGFDVPDMLAAGERDVLVPESGAQAARDFLIEADLMPSAGAEPLKRPNPVKLLAGFIAGAAITTLIIWLLVELGAG